MASQGPLSAGTGASSGSPAWSNPTRIVASDDSRTTVNNLASLATSGTLASSQHGFAIPSGATINGILVEIERHGTSGASDGIEDSSIRLATGGAAVGDNKATTTTWPSVGSEAYASYGGAADTWGRTWTDTEINSTDFGVQIVAVNTDAAARDVRVDHVRITVHYTTGGGTPVTFAPTIVGAATVTAAVTSRTLFTPTVSAAGTVSAAAMSRALLGPSVIAAATVTASVRRRALLTPSVAAATTITAAVRSRALVSPTVASASTVTAEVSVPGEALFTVSVVAALSVTAGLRSPARIAPTVVSASTVTAGVRRRALMVATVASTSTVAASLRSVALLVPTIEAAAVVATALHSRTFFTVAVNGALEMTVTAITVPSERSPRIVTLIGSDRSTPALVGTDRSIQLVGSVSDG